MTALPQNGLKKISTKVVMHLKPNNYVDAHDDIMIINLESPSDFAGQTTCVVKRSGIWPVVVRYGAELARLENRGDSVCLLALPTGWVVLS